VELLQPVTQEGNSAYAREERSVIGQIHMRLLDLVRPHTAENNLMEGKEERSGQDLGLALPSGGTGLCPSS
jgi:hypothetical protein